MFDLLTKTVKLAVNVATLPVSVAADVVTMGGAMTDRDEPYTAAHAKRVMTNVEDLAEGNGG